MYTKGDIMKKIILILVGLLLIGCEEGEITEASSKIEGFSHLLLSTEESQSCTINWLVDFNGTEETTYRNGVLYDETLPNQEKIERFTSEISYGEGVFESEFNTITVEKEEGYETYRISIFSLGSDVADTVFTNVEISEDARGPFVRTRIDCEEGMRDQIYRLGNWKPEGGAI